MCELWWECIDLIASVAVLGFQSWTKVAGVHGDIEF